MSNFKNGDRVLVEAAVIQRACAKEGEGILNFSTNDPHDERVHPHPGVPVADLLEMAHLAYLGSEGKWSQADEQRYDELANEIHAAREAAQEPKPRKGWVRVSEDVQCRPAPDGLVEVRIVDERDGNGQFYEGKKPATAWVHPDDIRTEEPTGVDQ